MKRLVVVESPTKAKTIRQFLPKGYQVEACYGHIRDLPSSAAEIPAALKKEPWSRLGVNVDAGFAPLYVVPADKKKVVKQLKDALKEADELYVATDEDREGESIGWHLLEVLKPKVPVRRMVFHEITREAIERALGETRAVDERMVDAQETRRILDRLVGYTLSPLLWKKVAPRLSAGRVQSVAVRLLVEREKERLDFVTASYWDLKATLAQGAQPFEATMTHLGERRLAQGRDFDETTGRLKPGAEGDVLLLGEADATALAARLRTRPFTVTEVEQKPARRSPAAPFITSTLQQEANRKLGLPARRTMQIAQALYEQGLITYMRTDSPTLSSEALDASRRAVTERYGREYLSPQPRQFSAKVRNAQEAHEAIRPAGTAMRTRQELGLGGPEGALYDLIWKRTVASQMADARLLQTRVTVEADDETGTARFRASGQVVEFAGFFRAYVEGSDDPAAALDDRDSPLPALAKGDRPDVRAVEADGHETKPPARYTDATLVQTLERDGIGRPSTYASIIDTIVNRGYVRRTGNQLVPTFTAFATTNLLEGNFETLVDTGFTAEMEGILDDIASGDKEARPYLERFYRGEHGLETQVDAGLDRIDARAVSTLRHAKWEPHVLRVGKYGPYAEGTLGGETVTASLPDDVAPADLDAARIEELLSAKESGDNVLGIHPEHDLPILLREGPYGPYVQLGDEEETKPKRSSLPKGVRPDQVDLALAIELLALPRTLGTHPETGQPVKAGLGRFGPFVQHGSTFASLKAEDDLMKVGLDRALELLAAKTRKSQALRTLGTHPETGAVVEVFEGRYGPYVKHQKTNATLPKETAPEDVTLDQALLYLAEKEGKGKKGKAKAAPKKAATKKAAPKKTTPKKAAPKKAAPKAARATKTEA